MNKWIVSGFVGVTLALPVRAFDALDEIKSDLAKCRNCQHRTLLQARLNYRLKMIQYAETGMGATAGSVPGMNSGTRQTVAGISGTAASNAGAGVGGNVRGPADNTLLRGQTAMSAYVRV